MKSRERRLFSTKPRVSQTTTYKKPLYTATDFTPVALIAEFSLRGTLGKERKRTQLLRGVCSRRREARADDRQSDDHRAVG